MSVKGVVLNQNDSPSALQLMLLGFMENTFLNIIIMKIFCTLYQPAEDAGGAQIQIEALKGQVKSGITFV